MCFKNGATQAVQLSLALDQPFGGGMRLATQAGGPSLEQLTSLPVSIDFTTGYAMDRFVGISTLFCVQELRG
jgi:hypothetical protein